MPYPDTHPMSNTSHRLPRQSDFRSLPHASMPPLLSNID